MTGEIRMSLAVAGRKRQTVQTARCLAKCSRTWRLWQETRDGRLLTDGTVGRAAAAWTTSADGDDSLLRDLVDTWLLHVVMMMMMITNEQVGLPGSCKR